MSTPVTSISSYWIIWTKTSLSVFRVNLCLRSCEQVLCTALCYGRGSVSSPPPTVSPPCTPPSAAPWCLRTETGSGCGRRRPSIRRCSAASGSRRTLRRDSLALRNPGPRDSRRSLDLLLRTSLNNCCSSDPVYKASKWDLTWNSIKKCSDAPNSERKKILYCRNAFKFFLFNQIIQTEFYSFIICLQSFKAGLTSIK